MQLRPGTAQDIDALNAIAFAAKAHWGYTPEQLEIWRADLVIDPERLATQPICVAEEAGKPIAFAQLDSDTDHGTRSWALIALWVHPAHMRKGLGKTLLAWAAQHAASHGQQELAIDSEPNAEAFYLACGAHRVGEISAPIPGQAQRVRPQLRLRTIKKAR